MDALPARSDRWRASRTLKTLLVAAVALIVAGLCWSVRRASDGAVGVHTRVPESTPDRAALDTADSGRAQRKSPGSAGLSALHIRVRDRAGQDVVGARVRLLARDGAIAEELETDAAGRAEFEPLAADAHHLDLDALCVVASFPSLEEIFARDGSTAEVEITVARGAELALRVHGVSGEPMSGRVVECLPIPRGVTDAAACATLTTQGALGKSDVSGDCHFAGLGSGSWRVLVRDERGALASEHVFTLRDDERRAADVACVSRGRIQGSVTEAAARCGAPVRVLLQRTSADVGPVLVSEWRTTGSGRSFRFADLVPASYVLVTEFSAGGRGGQRERLVQQRVEVGPGEDVVVDIVDDCETFVDVAVRVRGASGPLRGIVVEALDVRGDVPSVGRAETDESGACTLSAPRSRLWRVVARCGGVESDALADTHAAAPSVEIVFGGSVLRGRVESAFRSSSIEVAVHARSLVSGRPAQVQRTPLTTRRDGTFAISGLAPGSYRCVARDAAGRSGSTDVVVGPGDAYVDCTIVLDAATLVRGRVVDAQGLPVAGAAIAWIGVRGNEVAGRAVSDSAGEWRIGVRDAAGARLVFRKDALGGVLVLDAKAEVVAHDVRLDSRTSRILLVPDVASRLDLVSVELIPVGSAPPWGGLLRAVERDSAVALELAGVFEGEHELVLATRAGIELRRRVSVDGAEAVVALRID